MKRSILFSYAQGGPDPKVVVHNSVKAEKLGYDYVWVADHFTDTKPVTAVLDAWTVLSYIGSKTNRVYLGPGVTDVYRMHPAKIANTMATLDHLTSGRIFLGIGAGEIMNTQPYGMIWEDAKLRISRLKEAINVMKMLWRSSSNNPVSFKGQFYNLTNAHLDLLPLQKPFPRIYMGAFRSPTLLKFIGEQLDGWFPATPNTLESFKDKVNLISEGVEKSRRNILDIDIILNIPTVIDDKSNVIKEIKQKFKRTLFYHRDVLKILGGSDLIESLPKNFEYQYISTTNNTLSDFQKMIDNFEFPDELLDKAVDEMMAIGTADQCIDKIAKFVEVGATHIDPGPPVDSEANYEKIAKHIIPYFK